MCQLPYLNSPTLSNNMKLFNHLQKYTENIDVFIEDQSSIDYSEASFKSTVEYRSLVDIRFAKPFHLFHGRTYKLGIIMNQPGLYMAGTLNSWEIIYKTLKLTFMKSTELMFIHALVIAKPFNALEEQQRLQ
ncbi:unnamed protein product [Nesidiocoris tenuis]|nr:unnamed protein product [Nesidiocoris tenuis]